MAPDDMDEFEEGMDRRKRIFFGKLKKCSHCGMFDTREGDCPYCKKGTMKPT